MSVESRHSGVEIRDVADHVEVSGLSKDDVVLAVSLLKAAGEEQLGARTALHAHVKKAMLGAHMPLVPVATQRQAQRRSANRERLLAVHGYETHATLATQRKTEVSSVRTWVARTRSEGRMFTVKVSGQTIIPAVQLTPDGQLDEAVSSLVSILRESGMDGWSLWSWLCSPSGLLSGDVPADVAQENPQRAAKAARRASAELARARSRSA